MSVSFEGANTLETELRFLYEQPGEDLFLKSFRAIVNLLIAANGARLSSGAAMHKGCAALRFSEPTDQAYVAAPEDGRAPPLSGAAAGPKA